MSDENPSHRPPKYGQKMKRRSLYMPDKLYEYAKEISDDDTFAGGVRQALEEHRSNVKQK
jgi:hypothetical protein